MNKVYIIGAVGLVAIAAYFVVNATKNTQSESCSDDWTDYLNPYCQVGNAVNTATSEINTILIIVGVVLVLVVALLAFGPQTGHLAKVGALAL